MTNYTDPNDFFVDELAENCEGIEDIGTLESMERIVRKRINELKEEIEEDEDVDTDGDEE